MSSPHVDKVGKTSIPRNKFNLSWRILGNTSPGLLMPIQFDMCIPSDIFSISHDIVIRMMPMIAPILQPIDCKTWTFFVPIRLVDENFEQSISGGQKGEKTGDDVLLFPKWNYSQEYTNKYGSTYAGQYTLANAFCLKGAGPTYNNAGTKRLPVEWLRAAYNLIWNEYFRDEWLQDEIDIHGISDDSELGIMRKNWKKDYFTSALKETQKGTAPSLPITGIVNAEFTGDLFKNAANASDLLPAQYLVNPYNSVLTSSNLSANFTVQNNNARDFLNQNSIDLSTASAFDVNDLRTVVQIQKWLERNARAGTRYTELLQSRYQVTPQDSRLQRPELVGMTSQPIVISEVLQNGQPTQESSLPQGNMAGHGLSANRSKLHSYKVQEHGILMTIMCICPKRAYTQGNDRQFTMENMYDMPFPEFTHLGEREIYNYELFIQTNEALNNGIFGFTGIYNEYRSHHDNCVGDMGQANNGLGYWSMLEKYASTPNLNSDFITMKGDFFNSVFSVRRDPISGLPARNFIYNIGNHITAYRPLPLIAEPGLIDHF